MKIKCSVEGLAIMLWASAHVLELPDNYTAADMRRAWANVETWYRVAYQVRARKFIKLWRVGQ